MDQKEIKTLLEMFESYSHFTNEEVEFWLARDLQKLLGYSKWSNFFEVIQKAKNACDTSWYLVSDHFADVSKTISMPKWATKDINDMMLTRYACYLVAQNWDSRKPEIAFAQTYFATQTRKLEIITQKILLHERVHARKKLSATEKELSKVIYKQTDSNKNFGRIHSKWDAALFGRNTQEMKKKRKIKWSRALADFMPTLLLKAKDFATEITIYNAKQKNMQTENEISHEHITNNASVRDTLINRWIKPEDITPEEDIKKVEKRLQSEQKTSLKNTKKLA